MSESQLIFIDGNNLPTVEQIHREAQSRNYGLDFDSWEVNSISQIEGYWPCTLSGSRTGFEFFLSDLEVDDITSFDINEDQIEGKTHFIDLAFRDENEYKAAAIFTAIFCKLCNGVAFDENLELKITTKNAVRWAKKIKEKGFNAPNKKPGKDLWINVSGRSIVLENDLPKLIGSELLEIHFLGVWAGGISLWFEGPFRLAAGAWRLHGKNNRIFDVTRYRLARAEEWENLTEIDIDSPSESSVKEQTQLKEKSETALQLDEMAMEDAKHELSKWPEKVTVSNVNWNNRDCLTVKFKEIDGGFDLLVTDNLPGLNFRTPFGRDFHLKLDDKT